LSFSYNFWESEWDLDLVSDFYEPAGLAALEGKAKEKAKQKQAQSKDGSASKPDNPAGVDEDDDYPTLSLHASQCADIDLVREHLDGGVLRELVEQWKAKMEGNDDDDDDKLAAFHRGYYGYRFMLLGACAMTLGCKLECDFKELLIKRYRTSGLMRDALYMMQLALGDGPDRYKDTPYDFWSKGLVGADPEEYEEDETFRPEVVRRDRETPVHRQEGVANRRVRWLRCRRPPRWRAAARLRQVQEAEVLQQSLSAGALRAAQACLQSAVDAYRLSRMVYT
jgi:hypothetical protein